MNIRTIQKMQRFERDMDDPKNKGQGKALVRLYMLEALEELCQWDAPWTNDTQEEARYWWEEVMNAQSEYEKEIGA